MLVAVLPQAWAWRAMFWLGVLPALLVLARRRGIADPTADQRRRETASPTEIFRPGLPRDPAPVAYPQGSYQGTQG
ncbi:MFS family permease [Kitasatospora sp. MAA19]|uniref:hypothetical protein n=1 Tax=unclassified Kitasatospora TaxID=2633591 RepID=UPI00247357E8|nr:hypothetical protein [Kitasatospora sp. MAA19]MDH6708885.1 MFS family permease [Kitasatospora sp. MAA19]